MEQVARNRELYQRITDAWELIMGDSFHWGMFDAPHEDLATATARLIDTMAALVQPTSADRILDVGCGIGGPALYLWERYRCAVTGISVSDTGVDRANARARAAGAEGVVCFETRDAMATGLPESAFDVAWIMESAHLMPDKGRLFAECHRTLKKGGRLVFCDLTFRRYLTAREMLAHREELQTLERAFGQARLDTLEYLAGAAARAGFERIETIDVSAAVTPTLVHWKTNVLGNWPRLMSMFSAAQRDDFLTSCDILARFYADGIWGYGILSTRK